MSTSIVKVYNSGLGKWEKNARVVLCWDGFLNAGMSRAVYTDANGIAEVQHSSSGKADIYINGKRCGTMQTPGSKTVTV